MDTWWVMLILAIYANTAIIVLAFSTHLGFLVLLGLSSMLFVVTRALYGIERLGE